MSIQLLQTTRIGVAVNGVRKHCSDKEVVSLAKVLIKNWKRLLESPRTPKGEKGEEREKVKKKKEKGFDCSDWKPEAGLSPPRKKRGEEPKSSRSSSRVTPDIALESHQRPHRHPGLFSGPPRSQPRYRETRPQLAGKC
uniref:TFIIS N-terminal domain-containing protein n=1 Tax=Castor canadensis TaxID=51338 RepID=A0A8C0ZZK2_CASCN